jgi:cell wall-associated NlpC family hydrolase
MIQLKGLHQFKAIKNMTGKTSLKAIFVASALLFSCTLFAVENEQSLEKVVEKAAETPASSDFDFLSHPIISQSNEVITNALKYVGTPYKWGGETKLNGFDCSGFVKTVFMNAMGIALPRTAMQMAKIGVPVEIQNLIPGDLIFFKNKRGNYAHVGIYIGDDRFIHAPQTGSAIQVDYLNKSNFGKRISGARRIDG